MVKTALNNHLLRADSSAPGYCEVDTSLQVVAFGNAHLAKPRYTSGIKERIFSNILPATVERRKALDKEDSGHSGQGVATRRWAGVQDQVVPWGTSEQI